MLPRAERDAGALKVFYGSSVELIGGVEHGMVRPRALGTGGIEHQQACELRRHLAQILEVLAVFENVGDSVVVYRITKGLGLLPEMSIHTLFVCKYSRIASDPLSLPIPDRLYPPNGDR